MYSSIIGIQPVSAQRIAEWSRRGLAAYLNRADGDKTSYNLGQPG